ncbi:MAG: carbohydrate-binding domain-containing protein, partial [Pseudomonadota bacterium]
DERFEVVGNELRLREGVALDHEAAAQIAVDVTATDTGGLSRTERFEIDVADVNEGPTSITLTSPSENLIRNGSFEEFELAQGRWRGFNEDPSGAWSNTHGHEVWDRLRGWQASDGDQYMELDHGRGVDSISQSIDTQPGQIYRLGMDIRERLFGGTDTVEVYWNGELVQSIDPETADWTNFEMQVVGTGQDVLELREPEGDNDSYGALIDNLTLVAEPGTIAENAAGAVIGMLQVEDPDIGDSHSFEVSDARFEVVDGVVKLKEGVALDHEAGGTVGFDVIATDSGGNSKTQNFEITVANIDEPAPDLSFLAERPDVPSTLPEVGDIVTLDVTLAGEAYRGDPSYVIVVDGKVVSRGQVDWARETTTDGKYDLSGGRDEVVWKDVSIDLEMPLGGFQTVEVRFPNDAYRRNVGDRNLLVDKIAIDGNVIEAEGLAVEYQGGRFADGVTSERMPWRGELDFDVSNIFGDMANIALPDGPYVIEGAAGAIVGRLDITNDVEVREMSVSDARFEITDGSLKLKDGVALDFEDAESLTVSVEVVGTNGMVSVLGFDVAVIDQADEPSALSFSPETLFRQELVTIPGEDAGTEQVNGVLVTGQIETTQGGIFDLSLPNGVNANVVIDGVPVIETVTNPRSFAANLGEIELSAGLHSIKILYVSEEPGDLPELIWAGPGLDGVQPVSPASGEAVGSLQAVSGQSFDLTLGLDAPGISSVVISDLPPGTSIKLGDAAMEADAGGQVDITGLHNLPVSIQTPEGFVGDVDAVVTAQAALGGEAKLALGFTIEPLHEFMNKGDGGAQSDVVELFESIMQGSETLDQTLLTDANSDLLNGPIEVSRIDEIEIENSNTFGVEV